MSNKINGITEDQAALFSALTGSCGGSGSSDNQSYNTFDEYGDLMSSINSGRPSSDDFASLSRSVNASKSGGSFDSFDDLTSSIVHGRGKSSPAAGQSIEQFIADNCPYFTRVGGDGTKFYVTHNITIGRLPHNDIQLVDTSVSRLHCRVFIRGGEYYCVDMTPDSSSNKAVLDGMQINNGHPNNDNDLTRYRLSDGSKLSIGNSVLEFHLPPLTDRSYAAALADCVSSIKL